MKYAIVGTGGRATSYIDPLINEYNSDHELVALCDPNPQRINYHRDRINSLKPGLEVQGFSSEGFDEMIKSKSPDVVIVTTVDSEHDKYIIKSLESGCNVVTEKPMTISAEKCSDILRAVNETGLSLRVAFNYRWVDGASRVKELLAESIGPVHHVSFQYLLDTDHGADYFRRWHRNKVNSGGLLIHKATHHFDLINWWTNSVPDTVYGIGKLAFYGNTGAPAQEYRSLSEDNPFQLDLSSSDQLKGLYLDAEPYDGYRRNQDVFSEGIDIEDTMSVVVKYRTGIHLSYSLVAYSSMEGFTVTFHGEKGRLHYEEIHHSHTRTGSIPKKGSYSDDRSSNITIQKLFQESSHEIIPMQKGGHGGADPLMMRSIFTGEPDENLQRSAGHQQGAASMLIGAAANISIRDGNTQKIKDLCPILGPAKELSELT